MCHPARLSLEIRIQLFFFPFLHFSHSNQRSPMVFNRNLSDSKSPRVSKTLFTILADLNNSVVWMVSSRSHFFINPLVIGPSAPITIGITVTFMSYFFSIPWQGPSIFLSSCFLSFLPCRQPERQSTQFSGFLLGLTITITGHVTEIS